MRNPKKKRRYAALEQKLFARVCLLFLGAVLVVILARALTFGRLAEGIVRLIGSLLHVSEYTAMQIYFYRVSNFMDEILALTALLLFLLLCRGLIRSLTEYLDAISQAIDSLAGGGKLDLPPELNYVENRLLRLRQTVEAREAQASQEERRKNDLLLYSAHDVRTPLTSVIGYLLLLDRNRQLPEEERQAYTGVALSKAQELEEMLDEMFEISRYNLREIRLDRAWVDLFGMLSQISEDLYPLLRADGKRAVLDVQEGAQVWGDADKLARVFNNLLKNAVLYGQPDSEVKITARSGPQGADVVFANACAPIPQERLDRLFEQFYRGSSQGKGAGVGLAIAREIVSLHGGAVAAQNIPGGVSFTVHLPPGESPPPS